MYTPFDYHKITDYLDQAASDAQKLDVRNLIEMYNDNWYDQIREELARQFSQKVRRKLRNLITTEFNLLKRVTNEISLVYKRPATRKAVLVSDGEDGSKIEADDKNYNEMLYGSNIDAVMKQVNKYVTFLNQVVVRPVVRNGKMEYDMLTLDNCEIVTDPVDWKRIVAVKYYIGLDLPSTYEIKTDSDIRKRTEEPRGTGTGFNLSEYNEAYLWALEDSEEEYSDDDGFTKVRKYRRGMIYRLKREGGKDITIDDGEEIRYKENGEAILPFVIFWKDYPVRQLIDTTTGTDLRDANIRLAVNVTHMQYLLKFQSYKVAQITTRDASTLPKELCLDPGHLYVNEDSEGNSAGLEVIDFTASIKEIWDALVSGVTLFLSNYFISPANFTLSGSPSSGFAMKISNQAKLEFREDQVDIYREREHELFRISRIVWNTDVKGKPISEKAELRIDFAEPTFPESPDEQMTEWTFLKTANAVTDIDLIMRRNPDLTREEATKEYMRNKAFNQGERVALKPAAAPAGMKPKEDEDTDEGGKAE